MFRSPIDASDEGRFQEALASLEPYFGAIDEPELVQLVLGESSPPKPVLKHLADYGRDGKLDWSGSFGENAVSVACNRYTGWLEVWPQIMQRLGVLLACIDPFKNVGSIEYSVTDSMREEYRGEQELHLRSKNIFRKGTWVPDNLMSYEDPRWDFESGMFIEGDAIEQQLERVEAKAVISGSHVVASITNTFSLRFRKPVRLKELLKNGELDQRAQQCFEEFHDKNKETIRSILVDDLLERMGLQQ